MHVHRAHRRCHSSQCMQATGWCMMQTTSKTTSQCSYDGHTAWHVVCTLISIPAQGALPAMTHTAPNTSLTLAAHVTTIVKSPTNATTHTYSSLLEAATTHTSKHSATASCAHVGKGQQHTVAHQLHAACSNNAAEALQVAVQEPQPCKAAEAVAMAAAAAQVTVIFLLISINQGKHVICKQPAQMTCDSGSS